ncbi:MAG TPA: glycosyltransferase [Candidatus Woesebacteria bacterium]|nr:glycosyltransferase [Candidatus Woesebacteria bacterium]
MTKILVVANNNLGNSLSGGDQILINFIKNLPKNTSVDFIGCTESIALIAPVKSYINQIFQASPENHITKLSTKTIFFHQLKRFFFALTFIIKNYSIFSKYQYIYTASDFLADSIFGIVLKIFNFKIKWIAGFYLFAPNPFIKSSPYNSSHHKIRGLIYYFGQIPVYILVKLLADYVFVTSTPDIKKFFSKRLSVNNIFVVQGGVYIPPKNSVKKTIKYQAVYLGRLHVQKGVLELISIWDNVVKIIPTAKLAIIGDGELEPQIKQKIKEFGLTKNIQLLGFLNGDRKYQIFKQSLIVVHPATYDSGGMAAAEAMAWGLPGVSYDLEALKTYYPYGMLKTKCFDQKEFANNIIFLLKNKQKYLFFSKLAIKLINTNWNWSIRFKNIFQNIFI